MNSPLLPNPRELRQDYFQYPGQPLVLAAWVLQMYPDIRQAAIRNGRGDMAAEASSDIPGAGGQVTKAVEILLAFDDHRDVDRAIQELHAAWRRSVGGGNHDDVFQPGQEKAERLEPMLQAHLGNVFPKEEPMGAVLYYARKKTGSCPVCGHNTPIPWTISETAQFAQVQKTRQEQGESALRASGGLPAWYENFVVWRCLCGLVGFGGLPCACGRAADIGSGLRNRGHEDGTCPLCHQRAIVLLIGEAVPGWHFSLRVYPDAGLSTIEAWEIYMQQAGVTLYADDGAQVYEVSFDTLLRVIKDRRWDGPGIVSLYAEEGVNRLLRAKDDPQLIGHGEGPWSYFKGEP